MNRPVHHTQKRWQAWLGLFLVIPLAAASAASLFLVYRNAVTGQLSTVAKSYGSRSRTILFEDSPVWFVATFAMHAAFALMLVGVTVVLARMCVRRLRARD